VALFDRWRRTEATAPAWEPPDYFAAYELSLRERARILDMTEVDLWESQPYLRTVVTFLARNIAQLGLHVHRRVTEQDRPRVQSGPLVDVLKRPNDATTSYELVYGLIADLALFDKAHWLLDVPGSRIVRLPPLWVQATGGDALTPTTYVVRSDDRGHTVHIPASAVVTFDGWHPLSLQEGATAVHALREILAEQVQASEYRLQVWKRGGRHTAVLSRPADAPEWSDAARAQFKADWYAKFSGEGPEAGGTPILEDGMTLNRNDFSAHEQQFVEGARLALNTVASVYHINPTMIGLLDNANYSNVREFRKMLYGDTLGPVIAQVEDRINSFVVPRFSTDPDEYVEFNLEEKLQGNFEEQITALQSAVGRPWLTADEARGRLNMASLGGDAEQLVTPLNVVVGGLASPRDTAPPPTPPSALTGPPSASAALPQIKARAEGTYEAQAAAIMGRYFRHQGQAIRSRLGHDFNLAGAWDDERWDKALTGEVLRIALLVTPVVGRRVAKALGFDEDAYDLARVEPFLASVADRIAGSVNKVTRAQLVKATGPSETDPAAQVNRVFEVAEHSRSSQIATTHVTLFSGIAAVTAGQQLLGGEATKTWRTTSPDPRPSCRMVNGETVPIGGRFSNGAAWPADGGLNVDEKAGCRCELTVNRP